MKTQKTNRLLAMFICLCMVVGLLPVSVFAAEQTCPHHPVHTTDCGYQEARLCGHQHAEGCYTGELICGYGETAEAAASGGVEHTHTPECRALDCPHERGEHDDACGHTEAKPCEYRCELCGAEPSVKQEKQPGGEAELTACTLTEGCTLPAGHEGECVTEKPPINGVPAKTIAAWTFIDDDNYLTEGELALTGVNAGRQADFGTVVSMLPTQIRAEVEGETDPIPVDITGWSCPEFAKDPDGNWPLTGEYTFTAKLQKGYACEPLPTVKVLVGGAELYGTETGDFTVTGDTSKCAFTAPVLTIGSGATVTIKNTDPATATIHRIKVAENATNVNITLDGVNFDLSDVGTIGQACAFDMTDATVVQYAGDEQ